MIKNNIVKRWALTVLSGIIVVIIIIGIAIGIVLKNQYYNSVKMTLNSRATSMFVSDFASSTPFSDESFNKLARHFVNNFSDKHIMEVWVIDKNGRVVVSSTGFSVSGEEYPDYDYAKISDDGKGVWTGYMQNGEKVMALSYLLPEIDGASNGAVRYIISLNDIDGQLQHIYILIGFLVLIFVFFVYTSGAYFVKSIINPVKKINETASKIAKGDFNVSIEQHKYNDEIGQLCDTINNMAFEIGEAERMKNEFISTISHELRTPLTAIKGWGETIRFAMDNNDEDVIDKGINVIVNESERLTSLVEELLDFSRMESGKLSLKNGIVDIAKELSDILEIFRERSERENIQLITEMPTTPVKITGDANRLKQAFVNIIDNSFKYNKSGGFVRVSLENINNTIKIIISDNGCGISKNDLPRIREKFYKANNSERGSGIGLAVTDEIIKLHCGEMIIESKIGKGTTTTLILPKNYRARSK